MLVSHHGWHANSEPTKRCFRGHLHIIATQVQPHPAIESSFFNPCNEVEKGWVIVPEGHGERVETSCRNTHRNRCRRQQLHAPPNPATKQRLDPQYNMMMVEMVTCSIRFTASNICLLFQIYPSILESCKKVVHGMLINLFST